MKSVPKPKSLKSVAPESVKQAIIKKSRDFKFKQKQTSDQAASDFLIKQQSPVYPEIMTTQEAAEYIRSSTTTLQNYESVGYVKALRHKLPGKKRGKVMWLKSELDKFKFGLYQRN
jgi:hypothetical protein